MEHTENNFSNTHTKLKLFYNPGQNVKLHNTEHLAEILRYRVAVIQQHWLRINIILYASKKVFKEISGNKDYSQVV